LALRRVRRKADMQNYAKASRSRPGRHMLAAALMGNWLEISTARREAEVFGILRKRAKRAKMLLRFRRLFFIQKCFWTVILQPKSQQDQKQHLSTLFSTLQTLYLQPLQAALTQLKSPKAPTSPSARRVIKQTAFSRGPFKTINVKVLNPRTISKWGVNQLVRTLAEIRQRNLDKAMANMRNLLGKRGKISVMLEKRMWMFRQYLRKSVQRRVNKWWQFTHSQASSKTVIDYRKQFALLRVLKDDSLQVVFTRWKDANSAKRLPALSVLQAAVSKLSRIRGRRVKEAWRALKSRGNRWKLGTKAMERGLMRVLGRRLSETIKGMYAFKGKRRRIFDAGRKLLIVKKSKEIRDKYVALILLNQHKRSQLQQFNTDKTRKIKAILMLSGTLNDKIVKFLYHCWSCLVLKLRMTKDESTLRFFFEKYKQSGPVRKENVKMKLKTALQVLKNCQKYHLQRLFVRWGMRSRLIQRQNALKKSHFYPSLARKVNIWYEKTLKWPWRRLSRIRSKFQRVKNSAVQGEKRLTRILLQRGLLKLLLMRAISAKEGRQMLAARTILLLSQKRQRFIALSTLRATVKAGKRVSTALKRGITKLSQWTRGRTLPIKVHLFRYIGSISALRPARSLSQALFLPLQVLLLPVFHAFRNTTARVTVLQDRHKRIAAISLLHAHTAISSTAVLRSFKAWKGRTGAFHCKAQGVKLLAGVLKGRVKTVLQQTLGTMRRAKYQLVALRDKGKNVYRLITLSKREEGDYGKLERLGTVLGKCRGKAMLVGLRALRGSGELPASQGRRHTLLVKLGCRKDRRLCQAAVVLWRSSALVHSSILSTVLLGKAKAVHALNTYRRKVLLVGCWSSLRRTAVAQYWQRKQATRVIADALTTLKVAYLQTAFT